ADPGVAVAGAARDWGDLKRRGDAGHGVLFSRPASQENTVCGSSCFFFFVSAAFGSSAAGGLGSGALMSRGAQLSGTSATTPRSGSGSGSTGWGLPYERDGAE